jgi:hypothetical protein
MHQLYLVSGVGDLLGLPLALVLGVGDLGSLPVAVHLIIPVIGLGGLTQHPSSSVIHINIYNIDYVILISK